MHGAQTMQANSNNHSKHTERNKKKVYGKKTTKHTLARIRELVEEKSADNIMPAPKSSLKE